MAPVGYCILSKEDILARQGGDLFAVLLPNTKKEDAKRIDKVLRKADDKTSIFQLNFKLTIKGVLLVLVDLKKMLKELKEQSDTPIKIKKKIEKANQKLKETENIDGLNVGDKAPDFTLPDQLNNEVNLYEELENNSVILTFFRGSW